jgi:hypothetical protein
MARDEDERQRVIREDRMRKGKAASTASARKERVYCHLPERVKRQFFFVHDVPRHPSAVAQMPT